LDPISIYNRGVRRYREDKILHLVITKKKVQEYISKK